MNKYFTGHTVFSLLWMELQFYCRNWNEFSQISVTSITWSPLYTQATNSAWHSWSRANRCQPWYPGQIAPDRTGLNPDRFSHYACQRWRFLTTTRIIALTGQHCLRNILFLCHCTRYLRPTHYVCTVPKVLTKPRFKRIVSCFIAIRKSVFMHDRTHLVCSTKRIYQNNPYSLPQLDTQLDTQSRLVLSTRLRETRTSKSWPWL